MSRHVPPIVQLLQQMALVEALEWVARDHREKTGCSPEEAVQYAMGVYDKAVEDKRAKQAAEAKRRADEVAAREARERGEPTLKTNLLGQKLVQAAALKGKR